MNEGMNRREFLKYSAATGALIASGEKTIESVLAQTKTVIPEVDKLTIWVLADNYYDTNIAEGKNTKRYRVVPGNG